MGGTRAYADMGYSTIEAQQCDGPGGQKGVAVVNTKNDSRTRLVRDSMKNRIEKNRGAVSYSWTRKLAKLSASEITHVDTIVLYNYIILLFVIQSFYSAIKMEHKSSISFDAFQINKKIRF